MLVRKDHETRIHYQTVSWELDPKNLFRLRLSIPIENLNFELVHITWDIGRDLSCRILGSPAGTSIDRGNAYLLCFVEPHKLC